MYYLYIIYIGLNNSFIQSKETPVLSLQQYEKVVFIKNYCL